jgi:hypothetical protein
MEANRFLKAGFILLFLDARLNLSAHCQRSEHDRDIHILKGGCITKKLGQRFSHWAHLNLNDAGVRRLCTGQEYRACNIFRVEPP